MKSFVKHLASSFLTHLNYELSRPSEILDNVDIGTTTPRVTTTRVKQELLEIFPDLEPIDFNLVEELYVKRINRGTYYTTSFEGFNIVFLEAIKDLLLHTEESRRVYREKSLDVLRKFDHKKFGLNVQDFMLSESELREILHEMIREFYKGNPEKIAEIWAIVYKQTLEHQMWTLSHFESLLLQAWKESEDLLNNILPVSISKELKEKKRVEPISVPLASVLFTDFKGFTQLTEHMESKQLVEELDICFKEFDSIINRFSLEKIKTLGDGYMCAGGVPENSDTHIYDICLAGLSMLETIKDLSERRKMACGGYWGVRIGIHVGPLVAGVIGEHKFSYDIWGDTVNIASRMESSGVTGEVNISEELKEKVEKFFEIEYRGKVPAKNKGELKMYLLKGLKEDYQKENNSFIPNEKFYSSL